jgi:uncharacterized linocin/CFP29 family protein
MNEVNEMNNKYRELAPVTAAAWEQIEEEARRTFKRNVAGRRVVDVHGPAGPELAAVGTGHLADIEPPAAGVVASVRRSRPIVDFRVPFTVDRKSIDDVERGAEDADWQPVKDAARIMALAEDRTLFEGYPPAGIVGIRGGSSNPPIALPADVRDYPNAVSQALTSLRLAGVDGPYALLLGAEAYTAVSETSDHGHPVHSHLARLLDGEIIWAPAVEGAFLLSTRGGDYGLHLGQDLGIGYTSHDADSVQLYLQETFTFLMHTAEAVVALTSA